MGSTARSSTHEQAESRASSAEQTEDHQPHIPSLGWLQNPAYVDGGVDPPRFYHTQAQINDAIQVAANAGIVVPRAPEQVAAQPPVQLTAATPIPPPVSILGVAGGATAAAPEVGPQVHFVTVIHHFSDVAPATRTGKQVVKRDKNTKAGNVIISSETTRAAFIDEFLRIHTLSTQYRAGLEGPGFKLSWTGSNGGKTGAPTIETDAEFAVAAGALLQKKNCAVTVEFDTDTMVGYRARKTDFGPLAVNEELASGTHVPHVEGFSEEAQIHGKMILLLKKRWPCQNHPGEHGEDGYCYVTPTSEHIGLNSRKFKSWAAAMAAGDATKNEPPANMDFESSRDGRITLVRARGRSGPHAVQPPTPTPTPPSDTTALLMTAILSTLVQKRPRSRSRSRSPHPPSTPTRPRIASIPMSPIPRRDAELRACLSDFAEAEGIDMTGCEEALSVLELRPSVIPHMDWRRLCEITGVAEGRVVALQVYCKAWCERLDEKRAHLAQKRQRLNFT
ncbi:hypothetical protein FA95DRAFT_1557461 [Auriscalpium vulgare]|uniref:Uncharacterized protein n=1 Tax=Auriscalpium vulgare TaxID=40419 RepID=A0ACB8RXX9_9AGAM|nr:hypothetical protein FA95DRAFT_1557461 [Auriscalpium vulgare]